MVAESPLEQTAYGFVPTGRGWFVLNAVEAPWYERDGRGSYCQFEGFEEQDPHEIIRTGETACVIVAVGARGRSTGVEWGAYSVNEAARSHNAGVDLETTDPEHAYARFGASARTRYRAGWLTG